MLPNVSIKKTDVFPTLTPCCVVLILWQNRRFVKRGKKQKKIHEKTGKIIEIGACK